MLGDIWNLSPYYHSISVAELVEVLVMLIVGKSDGVGSNFSNKGHILFVVFLCYCVTFSDSVLMAANSSQWILFSVEDETSLGINGEASEADFSFHSVQDFILFQKLYLYCVEIRILSSVPEMRGRNRKLYLSLLSCFLCYCLSVSIQESVADGVIFPLHKALNFQRSLRVWSCLDAWSSEPLQGEVGGWDADYPYVPI